MCQDVLLQVSSDSPVSHCSVLSRSAGLLCGVRCGCSKEKCRLRKRDVTSTHPEEEDKENVGVRSTKPSNVTQLMKSKRIVAVQPTTPYIEKPDLEVSYLGPKLKASKDKMAEKPLDLTADISFIECQKRNKLSVYRSPIHHKFRTNHQN